MRNLLLILLLFHPITVISSPAEEPPDHSIPILETAHELFGQRMNFVANRLDSFFADQRADDELGRSNLRIKTNYELREQSSGEQKYQFRFNLRLPHLEEKFHLGYFNKKKQIKDKHGNIIKPRKKLETDWLFRADVGISVGIPPQVFGRTRLRKSTFTGTLIHRFVEEFAWFSDLGWIETSTLTTDQTISEDLLFRFTNIKKWEIIPKEFNTSHGPSLLQRLSDDDALSYGFNMASTIYRGAWYVSNYRLSLDYRYNLYKQWLFLDAIPGLDFPKGYSFRRNPFIIVQVEALFDN